MTKELSAAEQAFSQAKKQFVTLAERTTRALTKEHSRVARQLEKTHEQTKKIRAQIDTRHVRLTKAASGKAAATIETQIKELRQAVEEAREETRDIHSELAKVSADLASAREHLSQALHFDKTMAVLERQWGRAERRKARKKPTGAKKATAKKQPAAKKKAIAKKKPTAKKKVAAKKKPESKTTSTEKAV